MEQTARCNTGHLRLQAQADARTAGEVQTAWLKANLAPHFTQKLLRVVRDVLKWVAAHDGEPRHQFPLLAGSHLTEVVLHAEQCNTWSGGLPGCQLSATHRRSMSPHAGSRGTAKQSRFSTEAESCATPLAGAASAGALACHTMLPKPCMPAADWAPLGLWPWVFQNMPAAGQAEHFCADQATQLWRSVQLPFCRSNIPSVATAHQMHACCRRSWAPRPCLNKHVLAWPNRAQTQVST